MASKQLVGTRSYVLNTDVQLKIPVAQSYLPVQSKQYHNKGIKSPSNELTKDLIYSNDARNASFSLNILASDGHQ